MTSLELGILIKSFIEFITAVFNPRHLTYVSIMGLIFLAIFYIKDIGFYWQEWKCMDSFDKSLYFICQTFLVLLPPVFVTAGILLFASMLLCITDPYTIGDSFDYFNEWLVLITIIYFSILLWVNKKRKLGWKLISRIGHSFWTTIIISILALIVIFILIKILSKVGICHIV